MNTSVESNVWGRILHSLQGRLNQQALETWFRPIQFERLDNSQQVLHLRAPNQIVRDWVVSNYADALDESLDEQRLTGYSVGWVIGKVPPANAEPVTSSEQLANDDTLIEVSVASSIEATGAGAAVGTALAALCERSLSSN
jgi:chromosomal replication initiation ATPase DnaA